MKILKISGLIVLCVLILTGCNVKLNINSNLNQSSLQVEPKANENINQVANQNVNQATNENLNQNENDNINAAPVAENTGYDFDTTADNMVTAVKNTKGETIVNNLKAACGTEVMVYAKPAGQVVILKPYNPGSDRPVSVLYSLNLLTKVCKKLEISKELTDFGVQILSPDKTKVALALETKEAKELVLLNLINDASKVLVTLPEGETLNGGYGALSNHFDIKWLDDKTIQYTVYENTVENYATNAPEKVEKVLQVRIVKVE